MKTVWCHFSQKFRHSTLYNSRWRYIDSLFLALSCIDQKHFSIQLLLPSTRTLTPEVSARYVLLQVSLTISFCSQVYWRASSLQEDTSRAANLVQQYYRGNFSPKWEVLLDIFKSAHKFNFQGGCCSHMGPGWLLWRANWQGEVLV